MVTYLIFSPIPEDRVDLAERLVRSAICFFEAQGGAPMRVDLGTYARAARGGVAEVVQLVALTSKGSREDADELARTLEGVLRATLTAAKARAGDVRVFVDATARPRGLAMEVGAAPNE